MAPRRFAILCAYASTWAFRVDLPSALCLDSRNLIRSRAFGDRAPAWGGPSPVHFNKPGVAVFAGRGVSLTGRSNGPPTGHPPGISRPRAPFVPMGRAADGDIDAPPSPACLDGYGINAFALNCSRRGRWGRPIGGPGLFEHARQTLVGACTAIPRNGVTSISNLGRGFLCT